MNKVNYQKELDRVIETLQDCKSVPRLLLHSCCAPCSTYVLEYLSQHFRITLFYYNPNIAPEIEYRKRVEEQKRLLHRISPLYPIEFMEGYYNSGAYYEEVKGLEREPEGGERCTRCFRMRLKETARIAAEGDYDYFTTTLSISPLKDAGRLAGLGQEYEQSYGVKWLPSDFKKREGYKRSVELSKKYGLYRQNYCGCIFSKSLSLGEDLQKCEYPTNLL